VQKRSTVTNARQHLAARLILHVDIKGFFDSITTKMVEAAVRPLCADSVIATDVARLATLNGFLPQGSPASPILANLVCVALDQQLTVLASGYQAAYTRYGDNIAFSGDSVPAVDSVAPILASHGFTLGRNYQQRRGKAQYVTGLTVADSQMPRIPLRVKKRIRQILHYSDRYGFASHLAHEHASAIDQVNELHGWISYIIGVERELGTKLRKQCEIVLGRYFGRMLVRLV
jgi:hypothetical protein